MMRSLFAVACGVLVLGGLLEAGGWAVITLMHVPETVVAGEPTRLTYAVRQHGRTLLQGLRGRIELRSAGQVLSAPAHQGVDAGYYTATIVVPRAGTWTMRIVSGFNGRGSEPVTFEALPPGRATPPLGLVERGRRLFAAKGCITCHAHQGAGGDSLPVGPVLSGRAYQAGAIERLLAPREGRPDVDGPVERFTMPDLGLAPQDVQALAAFLRGDGQVPAP
jgi:mono/diheme cytochrome c family protein